MNGRNDNMLGTCQNAFWRNDGARVKDFRYCGAPAMNLVTLPGERALCGACELRSARWRENFMASTVEAYGVEGAARWLAGSYAHYLTRCAWAYECAATGRPMEQVIKAQREADQYAEIMHAMRARWRDEIRAAIRSGRLDLEAIELTADDLALAA